MPNRKIDRIVSTAHPEVRPIRVMMFPFIAGAVMLSERNSVKKDTAIDRRILTVEAQSETNGAFDRELIPSYRIDFIIFTFECNFSGMWAIRSWEGPSWIL